MLRRGWTLRFAFILTVGCFLLIYYVNLPNPTKFSLTRTGNKMSDNMEESSFFSKFLRSDNMVKPNTIEELVNRHGHDPRKNLKHKIVHFDLKGMPPLIKYYEELFPLLKKVGVTGVLMEYEDMFPYDGRLKEIANLEAYSKADIKTINQLAKLNDLQVIPLVQTFGHMEYVLKLEKFLHLREVPAFPQAICPSNNQSNEVIREMIDQIMSLHPGIEYFHIGSDEVYHIGQCSLCVDRMIKTKMNTVNLFLDHVKTVASYVKGSYNVKPIMWDDLFRSEAVTEDVILKSGIGPLVEIVVWNYGYEITIPPQVWGKYARVFQPLWIASAFKGAEEPNSMVVNETLYLSNHYSWIKTMQEQEFQVQFKGIILTGWQRYDHFTVPCELLPLGIPSLVSCMTFLNNSKLIRMDEVVATTSDQLDCAPLLNYCQFPGATVHQEIKYLHKIQLQLDNVKKSSVFKGWLNAGNVQIQFVSPSYLDSVYLQISSLRNECKRLESQLLLALREVYPQSSVTEWIFIYFRPLFEELNTLSEGLYKAKSKRTFPVRPLKYPTPSPTPQEF